MTDFRRYFILSLLFIAANTQAIGSRQQHPSYDLGVKLAECNAFYNLAAEQFAGMGDKNTARDMEAASQGARITSQLAFIQYSRRHAPADFDHVKLMESISEAQRRRLEKLHDSGGFEAISEHAFACNAMERIQNAMLQELSRRLDN